MLANIDGGERQRRWAAVLALAVAVLAAPHAAVAAPLRAEVNVHGTPDEVRGLEATLRSLFPPDSRLRVSAVEAVDGGQVLRQSFVPSVDDVVARAWIELHEGQRVTIYVADVSGERLLVRHLPRTDDDAELVREATARIVATALEALLSGAQIGVERAQASQELAAAAPASAPTPAHATEPEARAATATATTTTFFTLGAHYGVQLFSSQSPLLHGPGLLLGVSHGAQATRPGAALVGQLWWPASAHDSVASVRVYSGALRVLATLEHRAGEAVVLSAGVGGGVDWVRVEPGAASMRPVQLTPPTTLTTPAFRAAIGAKVRLAPGFSLYTTCALDADPSGTRYVSVNDGVVAGVLEPHWLRPSWVAGVATP